jgi:hypothetical protein
MNHKQNGYDFTLHQLGITKEAVAPWLARAGVGAKGLGKSFLKNLKEISVGSPIKALREIQAGKGLARGGTVPLEQAVGRRLSGQYGKFAPGTTVTPEMAQTIRGTGHQTVGVSPGMLREGFMPGKGPMGAVVGGLLYGLPAYESYKVMKGDAPDKAEQLGKILGGTALGLGTWRAFGLLGSMAATPVGEYIGAGAARAGRKAFGKEAPPPQPRVPYWQPRTYTPPGMMAHQVSRRVPQQRAPQIPRYY